MAVRHCIGCSKDFTDETKHSNHEAQCRAAKKAYEDLAQDIKQARRAQKKDEKDRKRKRKEEKRARKLLKANNGSALPFFGDDGLADNLDDFPLDLDPNIQDRAQSNITSPAHDPVPSGASGSGTRASGRPARRLRFPGRFADFRPNKNAEKLPTMSHIPEHRATLPPPAPEPVAPTPDTSYPVAPYRFTTEKDQFGVWRVYPYGRPAFIPRDPDSGVDNDIPALPKTNGAPVPALDRDPSDRTPFSSHTAAILTAYHSSVKRFLSNEDMDRLNTVTQHPLFSKEEQLGYNAERENKHVDEYLRNAPKIAGFRESSGWKKHEVEISLPCPGVKIDEVSAPKLKVDDVWLRSLAQVVEGVFSDPVMHTFELSPFEEYWSDPHTGETERMHGEIFTSPAMAEAQAGVNKLPLPEGETIQYERVVACLMQWSDATHLTSFGWAHLWPFYTMFGNQSKYSRCKPSCFACHHTAYAPDLPDNFVEEYVKAYGRPPSSDVVTHCKRELMHAVWNLLLDDEFMKAYEFGVVVRCADGVIRRIYPRFFTYAADYPERVLLATIKNNGRFPCPCCYVAKKDLHQMGTKHDMKQREKGRKDSHPLRYEVDSARRRIFDHGIKPGSSSLESILKHSEVPTRNAFGFKLGPLSDVGKVLFNYLSMFLPDVLHDFEVGIWKAVFIHLLRLLLALGEGVVAELNERYSKMPAFGRGTIRPFTGHASEMKKLAGRDFEDLLQCSIAVFDGLLPSPHNDVVLDLLFDLQVWHAYAKLRLHTTSSLDDFDGAVAALSISMRRFLDTTCEEFKDRTFEIPKETRARARAATTKAAGVASASASSAKKLKTLNIGTVKYHRLASFPAAVRSKGTSESWGTAIGELNHSTSKRRYPRTNKHNFIVQLANLEARERYLNVVLERYVKEAEEHIGRQRAAKQHEKGKRREDHAASKELPRGPSPLDAHHKISHMQKNSINIPLWLSENAGDFALTSFWDLLKDYSLARLSGRMYDQDVGFSDHERARLHIVNDTVYRHSRIRINYNTYDRRSDYDVVTANHAKGRSFVMVLSPDCDDDSDERFPYLYGHVIDVFHFYVQQEDEGRLTKPRKLEAVFLRYMEQDRDYRSGWEAKRLPRISYLKHTNPRAFGFIDPADIIRATHVQPAYSSNKTEALLPDKSIARPKDAPHEDYKHYYVGIFVDRDMMMLFRGGGVGHVQLRERLAAFRRDAECARQRALQNGDEGMPDFPPDSEEPGDDVEESDLDEDEAAARDAALEEDDVEALFSEDEEDSDGEWRETLRDSDGEEEEDGDDGEMLDEAGFAAF